jgi:SAM-dependent methyltransferase
LIVAGKDSSDFDAGSYWQERVGADADLSVVGHRAMGPAYNGEIYARRIEATESMLARHVDKPLAQLRVLDIGCGSGFYTGFWQARGVREYVGLDISSRAIERLADAYPEYRFMHADFTESLPDSLTDGGSFDIVTIFDVLYHIVEDQRVETAIANLGGLLAEDGRLFIMDFLCRRNCRVSKHVIYRARDAYLAEFRLNQLELMDSELLFHFLVPPIAGVRIIDRLFGGAFKIFGLGLSLNDRLATWAATKLRRLDTRMRKRNISMSNGELLVFATGNAVHD